MSKLYILLPSVIISALMLIALFDNPYGYYQFLRVAVPLLAVYAAYKTFQYDEDSKVTWLFIAIAIVFNPFVPIYLDRSLWAIINLAIAILIPAAVVTLDSKKERESGTKNSKGKRSSAYADKHSLMSEEGKQNVANRFYANERCRSIADAYAQRMDNEAKELLNLDTSLFTDKNPQMQALTTKALIGDHVEKIFQAAYHDKKLKDDEWRQAMGFAKGAATLIAQARTKEQKAFIIALSQFMLVNDYDVPIQQANFLLEGFLGEVKKN